MMPPPRREPSAKEAAVSPVPDAEVNPQLLEILGKQAGVRAINVAPMHAMKMMQSESARVDGTLVDDFNSVLKGGCVCLNNFVCDKKDTSIFEAIKTELRAFSGDDMKSAGRGGLIDWSKHEVYENPTTISVTFNTIVAFLADYFDVEVYATRLNYYRDGETWKPFHHDSHAYGGRALREDFTVGISLGQSRALEWLHEPSGRVFSFPQDNGDCFAFDSEVNQRFKHGVPKSRDPNCGDRFSIIAWGRRRSLNARNCGGSSLAPELQARAVNTVDDAIAAARDMVASHGMERRETSNSTDGGSANNDAKPATKRRKNRLQ